MTKLNQADQLNGLQAQGEYIFEASVARLIANSARRPEWSDWSGWREGRDIVSRVNNAVSFSLNTVEFSMTRKAGHWSISGDWAESLSDESIRNKITCEAATAANPFAATAAVSLPKGGGPVAGQGEDEDAVPVGGAVQATKLINGPQPVYPPFARSARIQGIVRFKVTIDKAGKVQDAKLVSGHPLLVKAAQDAVRQWEYQPTLSNGKPVSVVTTIDVEFKP